MKILYPNQEGGISVVHPTDVLPFEDVCKKDVPAGVPYLIVEDDVIPSDRSFRNAWEADFSNPDGYGIGADAYFAPIKAAAEAERLARLEAEREAMDPVKAIERKLAYKQAEEEAEAKRLEDEMRAAEQEMDQQAIDVAADEVIE